MEGWGSFAYRSVALIGNVISALIFVRVLFSWILRGRGGAVARFVDSVTDVFLAPLRNIIMKSPFGGRGMTLDFSPVLALFLVQEIVNFSYVFTMVG